MFGSSCSCTCFWCCHIALRLLNVFLHFSVGCRQCLSLLLQSLQSVPMSQGSCLELIIAVAVSVSGNYSWSSLSSRCLFLGEVVVGEMGSGAQWDLEITESYGSCQITLHAGNLTADWLVGGCGKCPLFCFRTQGLQIGLFSWEVGHLLLGLLCAVTVSIADSKLFLQTSLLKFQEQQFVIFLFSSECQYISDLEQKYKWLYRYHYSFFLLKIKFILFYFNFY